MDEEKKIPTLSNSTLSCSPDQATNSETTGFFYQTEQVLQALVVYS